MNFINLEIIREVKIINVYYTTMLLVIYIYIYMIFIYLEIIGEEKYIYLKKNLQKFLQFGEVTWRNQSVLGFIKLALLILVIHFN